MHTHEAVKIGDGSSEILQHTSGGLIVAFTNGARWTYSDVSPIAPSLMSANFIIYKKHVGHSVLTVNVQLAPDGGVYVLDSTNVANCAGIQPAGFPIFPEGHQAIRRPNPEGTTGPSDPTNPPADGKR